MPEEKAKQSQNYLQDSFLNQARKENINVTIHLVNGFQIRGFIRSFDSFSVLVDTVTKQQQLVYKHAISTITVNNSRFNMPKDRAAESQAQADE